MKKAYILVCSLVLLASCQTITVHHQKNHLTTKQVVLGNIGTDQEYIIEEAYNNIGIPRLNAAIKLQAIPIPFDKRTFKVFTKAKEFQQAEVSINYIDSIAQKPTFVNFQINDQVALLNNLNNKVNSDIKEYLQSQPKARVVTSLSIALPSPIVSEISQAETIYLEQDQGQKYVISLFKNNELVKIFHFSEGVIFAYKTSGLCWKEDRRNHLKIVDLVTGEGCPSETFSKASKAIKEENYFKL